MLFRLRRDFVIWKLVGKGSIYHIYSYFEKGCQKIVHVTVRKGNMGYVQYTVPDTVAVEPTFVARL